MTFSPDERSGQEPAGSAPAAGGGAHFLSHSLVGRNDATLVMLDGDEPTPDRGDPGTVILTCANCGAEMIERKCKLICRCGYFLSCSDYY